jgi:hypothetical protein
MSSRDEYPEDPAPGEGTVAEKARRLVGHIQASWELPEIAAAALLVVIALLAVAGMASGVIGAAGGINGFPSAEAVSTLLIQSTQWASVVAPFLVLSALGLVWWQVQGWAETLEDLDDPPGADGAAEGRRHIRRNRGLATWAGVSSSPASASSP